jgi:hypothetical protein
MVYYNIFYMGLSRGGNKLCRGIKLHKGIIYKRHLQVFDVSSGVYGGLPRPKTISKIGSSSYKKL